ncbi:D-aspartate oxidase [Phlegmacium glaucopus]|nr:D-aspartate oxidase [Phlegmacium glaucopus]
MIEEREKKQIIVLGAGVIGLTTALRILERGCYQVEIIAEVIPTDPKNIKYTSHWAGAHHVSTAASGTLRAEIDRKTFLEMWDLSGPGGGAEECFLRLHQTEFCHTRLPRPNPIETMPNFKEVPDDDLCPNAVSGFSFETVTIDVPNYLNYLLTLFLEKGGTLIRGHVQHIDEVLEAGSALFKNDGLVCPPDAVVVCVGLGARFLGGVEDKTVYPSRGQTVILHAPWVRSGRTFEGAEEWTYIIPRRSGDVVVGSTLGVDDWYPKSRPETTLDILRRGLALCPELAPPDVRASRTPTVDDILPIVKEEACGLRPTRKDGVRIELEHLNACNGRKIPVVYNYGHGSTGYISSIGSADLALRLVEEGVVE